MIESCNGAQAHLRRHGSGPKSPTERSGPLLWVEIDLAAIANNVRRVAEMVGPGVDIIAVVKDNAYGHGDLRVAQTALDHGAKWLAVASTDEGISLRQEGIRSPILVLGYTPDWLAAEAVSHDLVTTVFSTDVAQALSQAAQYLGQTAKVHIKVDTGLGRLGLLPEEVLPFARRLSELPALCVDGLFTHLASADAPDLSYAHWQLARFDRVLAALRAEALLPPHIHAANSAAILRLPEAHHNMVRLGIAMYGLAPSLDAPCPPGFQRALAFKCRVAQVRDLPTGSFVSYGCTFRTQRPSRIAVLPVGYAHGFRRAPAHWGFVLVQSQTSGDISEGKRSPIVGRVCMDRCMIDVTDIGDVQRGDVAVLIGAQGAEEITADEVAGRLGTINYEVITQLSPLVPRVFTRADQCL